MAETGMATSEGSSTAPQQTATPLASINHSMTNREITVQAVIENVRVPGSERAPYVVTLTQDGTTMPLVFWSDVSASAMPKLKTGNLIRAKVTISEYRDRLQLRLRSPANLDVVGAAIATNSEPAKVTPEPAPSTSTTVSTALSVTRAKVAIGEIKGAWVDRVVTIRGTIAASDNIGSGQRLHVQDGTGEIQVVIWENVLGGLAATEFQPGRVITLTGPVRMYRGTTEVVPEAASDVKLAPQ